MQTCYFSPSNFSLLLLSRLPSLLQVNGGPGVRVGLPGAGRGAALCGVLSGLPGRRGGQDCGRTAGGLPRQEQNGQKAGPPDRAVFQGKV